MNCYFSGDSNKQKNTLILSWVFIKLLKKMIEETVISKIWYFLMILEIDSANLFLQRLLTTNCMVKVIEF